MLKDEFYIVMEFCEDGDALSYLRKVHREESYKKWIKSILVLCIGVCDGMNYIHSKGYTHRDITVTNILVKNRRAMLADLGLARKIDESNENPNLGYIPPIHSIYAPPGIKEFPNLYSKGCDVYCFGIAVWEMLMLKKWAREDIERGTEAVLNDLNEFPSYFRNIISRCLHEEDHFRPTFHELLVEFQAIYEEDWSHYRKSYCDISPPSSAIQIDYFLPSSGSSSSLDY